MTRLLLASGSPSRLRLLREAGITPLTAVPAVDEEALEAAHPQATVRELVTLLARAKAHAVLPRVPTLLADEDTAAEVVVVACDSVLELEGSPVGKPHTAERTRALWQRMAGSSPVLWSAHWVGVLTRDGATSGWRLRDSREAAGQTRVHLASPTERELEDYIATGEPFEVAGALTIDGLGGAFVRGIEGDHHNVIGLSLPLLRDLLADLGVPWTSLWNRPSA
jgi:septum formation protein